MTALLFDELELPTLSGLSRKRKADNQERLQAQPPPRRNKARNVPAGSNTPAVGCSALGREMMPDGECSQKGNIQKHACQQDKDYSH